MPNWMYHAIYGTMSPDEIDAAAAVERADLIRAGADEQALADAEDELRGFVARYHAPNELLPALDNPTGIALLVGAAAVVVLVLAVILGRR